MSLEEILENNINVYCHQLDFYTKENNLEKVKEIIEKHHITSINLEELFYTTVYYQKFEIINYLLEKDFDIKMGFIV